MKKRLFSLLLAAALMLSLLPAVAMATETTPRFASQNMTLENIPLVNFYVAYSENPETAGYTMEVAIGGNAYTEAVSPEKYTEGTWVYKVPVKAKQLLKTVEVKLVKDGETVDEGTFQLETYYDTYAALENKDEKMVALLETLINYGKYAEYFNVAGTDDPAVEKIVNLGNNIAAAYAHNKNSDLPISAMLLLDEACVLRIAVPADQWATGYSLKVNGEYVAPKVKIMAGYVVCDIAGILPQNWDSVYKIQVLDTSDAVICTMKASVMSYANRALSMTGEEYVKLQGLMKAMFQYYRAADEYVGTTVLYEDAFSEVGYWVNQSNAAIAGPEDAVTTPYAKINADGKLEIAANNGSVTSAVMTLPNRGSIPKGGITEGVVAFEFDVASSALSACNNDKGNAVYFTIWGNSTAGNGKLAIDVQLYSDYIVCFDGATRSRYACTYNANESYRVKIVANMDAETPNYSLYVDDVLAVKDFSMRNQTITCLNKIRLWATQKMTATMTYDNLVISQLEATLVDTTDPIITKVYSDTFRDKGNWQAYGIESSAISLDENKVAGDVTTGYVKINNGNQLEVKNGTKQISAAVKLSKAQAGVVGIEFNITSDHLSRNNALDFSVYSDGVAQAKLAIDIRLYSDKIRCFTSTTEYQEFSGTYVAGETYRVKILADVSEKLYSVYIDDVMIAENISFWVKVTALQNIRFWSTTKGFTGTMTYDNLVVYTITETTAE